MNLYSLTFLFLIVFGLNLSSVAQKKIHTKIVTKNLQNNNSKTKDEIIIKRFNFVLEKIKKIIQTEHYSAVTIGDSFSIILFNDYLKLLDKEKLIFYQSDINYLKKYESNLDDEWNNQTFNFLFTIDSIYNIRIKENKDIFLKIIDTVFNFNKDDSIYLNRDSVNFIDVKNGNKKDLYNAKKTRWEQYLKLLTLERMSEAIEIREKNTFKDSFGILKSKDTLFTIKSDSIIESETRAKIKKILNKMFQRFEKRFKIEEKFNLYINQIAENIDPHTNYLPPAEKRSFDETMNRKFYGIGAQLKEDDAGIKIERIITGGPAFKSKKIVVGDIILKVGQGNDSLVDILGFETIEAVKLIRGKENTIVTLIIKHPTGNIEKIKINREEIKSDEALVKSAIINDKDYKLGYLYVPEFYADFSNAEKGSQCYIDAATEIDKLKSENIDGMIIDLRNNGGGSLFDVIQMAGFFIFDGPVVQVKDKKNNVNILDDKFKWILYSGPIIVMVNELSASASEIFAAAIQDYKRGIIVGSSSTYGKGTVQTTKPFEFPKNISDTSLADNVASLKVTIQKFYRINGNSTQRLGVIPDIILPDRLEFAKIKEKDNESSLPYDKIKSADYKEWMYNNFNLNTIIENANIRINKNIVFNSIKNNAEWMTNIHNSYRSLKLNKYLTEEKLIKNRIEEIDSSINKNKDTLVTNILKVDSTKFKDVDKNKNHVEWVKSLRKDIYLIETTNIIEEMIGKIRLEGVKQEIIQTK